MNDLVIRADGLQIDDLLAAILPLFELDLLCSCSTNHDGSCRGDLLDLEVEKKYLKAIYKTNPNVAPIGTYLSL